MACVYSASTRMLCSYFLIASKTMSVFFSLVTWCRQVSWILMASSLWAALGRMQRRAKKEHVSGCYPIKRKKFDDARLTRLMERVMIRFSKPFTSSGSRNMDHGFWRVVKPRERKRDLRVSWHSVHVCISLAFGKLILNSLLPLWFMIINRSRYALR